MPKLLLIQPYHPSNVKLFGKMYMSQLTLPVIAALTPSRYDVKIVDENVESIDFREDVDLVGVSLLTPTAARGYEIAARFRARGVPVVLGGVHPSLCPDEAKDHCDAVVLGEAEGVWPRLLEDFEKGLLGKVYQSDLKPNLEHLPRPRRELMNEKMYVNVPKVEVSRGCPFDCSFCSTTKFFGRKMRYRPVEEVVQELKELAVSFVFFTDNNIVGNPKYAKELFRELIPLRIKWIGQGSLNAATDRELLKLARRSGCVGLLIGFESLSDKAVSAMGKAVNKVEKYKTAIKRLHRERIGIIGCFVFGFDEEDGSVFKRTVKFVRRLNIEVPQFTVLTPYPGTLLREKMEETRRILHNQWEKYDVNHVVFQPVKMKAEDLRCGYNRSCKKAYSYWSIVKRLARSLIHLRSFYRLAVFWQINVVYRRLYLASLEKQ
jgi:radical SAM superfamily enzyme YgiQ (UPF0313 family)